MAESSFVRNLKKRLRHVRRSVASGTGRPKAVHALRIELKRLRAHLRLLRAVDASFPYAEVYAPFKKLFARAGQARFWQLQASLLRRWPGDAPAFVRAYRAYLNRRSREGRRSLRTVELAALPRWRDWKREIQQSALHCTPAAVLHYFDGLHQTISQLQRQPSRRRPAQLHELRKTLKEYANNRRLVARHLGVDPGAPANVPADFDLLLGQWHDTDAACVQLAADLGEKDLWTGEELAGGKRLLQEWRKRERALWRALLKNLRGHINLT